MSKKVSIAIDAMGGDDSPHKVVEGVKYFLNKNKDKNDFIIKLFGDESKIKREFESFKIDKNKIDIIHTSSTVSNNETPLKAIKNSKNTSMWKCIYDQVEGNADVESFSW